MKKALLSLGLIVLVAGASISFQSCSKIKDELSKQIDPFNWSQQNLVVDVPVIDNTNEFSTGDLQESFSLDQIIKDNTPSNLNLSGNNVSSLKIDSIRLTILNPDAQNYFANFEYIKAVINTDKGRQAGKNNITVNVWANNIAWDPNRVQTIKISGDPNLELVDYFKGATKVFYKLTMKARNNTTKVLNVRADIDYRLVPSL